MAAITVRTIRDLMVVMVVVNGGGVLAETQPA